MSIPPDDDLLFVASVSVTSEQLSRLGPSTRAHFLRYRQEALLYQQKTGEAREKARDSQDPIIRKGWHAVAHSRALWAQLWDRLAMQTLRLRVAGEPEVTNE